MTTDTSWSELLHTDMGEFVRATMDDSRLTYHNINHIERLYAKANEWEIPYDCNLDGAILWHDAVYDAEPNKEIRSAALVQQCAEDNPQWFEHINLAEMNAQILSTIDHKITAEVSPLMIKLDLDELGDPHQRKVNFWSIVQESHNLYGVDMDAVCEAIFSFMTDFSETNTNNKYLTSEMGNTAYWDGVICGCHITALMAETVYTANRLLLDNSE